MRGQAFTTHSDYSLYNLVVLLLDFGDFTHSVGLPRSEVYGEVVLLLPALNDEFALAPADFAEFLHQPLVFDVHLAYLLALLDVAIVDHVWVRGSCFFGVFSAAVVSEGRAQVAHPLSVLFIISLPFPLLELVIDHWLKLFYQLLIINP